MCIYTTLLRFCIHKLRSYVSAVTMSDGGVMHLHWRTVGAKRKVRRMSRFPRKNRTTEDGDDDACCNLVSLR